VFLQKSLPQELELMLLLPALPHSYPGQAVQLSKPAAGSAAVLTECHVEFHLGL